jgi:hypothetical protein
MFTVHLRDGVFPGNWVVTAKAATLPSVLGFIGEFCALPGIAIESPWAKRNDRFVMEVCDWCDCWFTNPQVLAWVIAPSGFTPPREGGP